MSEGIVLCRLCASAGPTCCQGGLRDIYITKGDLERIGAYHGRDDFYEFRPPADPDYLDNSNDPVWQAAVFRVDGTRRVLKKNGADCLFLKANGCALPMHIRPLICRLYPYDYDAAGLHEAFAAGCPVHLVPPDRTLGQCLQMAMPDILRWHQTLYTELLTEQADAAVTA